MYKPLMVLVVLLGLATAALGQKNQLNLFIWSEYIDPQIITDFETEYDCKVTIDLYEDNESMLAKLQSGGAALYDICVPSDYIIPALLKLQLLAPLRELHERVPYPNGVLGPDERAVGRLGRGIGDIEAPRVAGQDRVS